jgi:glucan 1,3-beta-glucosidase
MVSRDCFDQFADISNACDEIQNYCQGCIQTRNCQEQILNIDSCSSCVYICSLSTVASAYQVSVDGKGIIEERGNVNGFASTVTVWKARE